MERLSWKGFLRRGVWKQPVLGRSRREENKEGGKKRWGREDPVGESMWRKQLESREVECG